MKQQIKYSVDRVSINQCENKNLIIVSGWCFHTDGHVPALSLIINGKRVDEHFNIFARSDVQNAFRKLSVPKYCGFQFVVEMEADLITSLELKTEKEEENCTLVALDQEGIFATCESHSILANIDGFNRDRQTGVTTVMGWAFSIRDEKIHFSVLNENEEPVSFDCRKMFRRDLIEIGYIHESQVECGYLMTFESKANHKYHLRLETDSEVMNCPLEEAQPAANGPFWRNLFTNLRWDMIREGTKYLAQNGLKKTIARIRQGFDYDNMYDEWFRLHRVTNSELEKQRKTVFSYAPKISLLVPTFNTPLDLLKEMIETVQEQSYSNWELCIADGSNADHPARRALQEYADNDARIKVKYLDQNYGIAGNTNQALSLATGEYTALYDHDDFLELNALYEVVNVLNQHRYDVIYTDEDKYSNEKKLFNDPNLKPDYSPDLLRSHNYITHLFVVRTEILRSFGGFNSRYDGAQDYDVILRSIEKAENGVYHLPKILYHWRIHEGSTAADPESKMYCYEAGERAIQDHLDRVGLKGKAEMLKKPLLGSYHVTYETPGNPLVSIIIPNYEAKKVLKRCMDSLFKINTYENIEIIIAENNSKSKEIFDYYEQLQKEHTNVKVVTWSGGEFNYSAINNFAEKYAAGEYLLFLNNDTEVLTKTAVQEMLGLCMREDAGCVGAKLLFENNTVQHAGVVIGFGGVAGHVFSGIPKDDPGFMMRPLLNCNYSAVTAACMMTKKSLFEEVGGFDEELAVAFNDIDYCLKIRKLNKLVIYAAFSKWHHYESVSRGYENDEKKRARFEREIKRFQDKWSDILRDGDPYYNANFDVNYTPFELH